MDFSNYHYCISTIPLFQTLTRDQIEKIQAQIQVKKFKAGQYLYQAGDDSDTLYLLQKGLVQIYRLSASGKEQYIRQLEAGDFIGESGLFSHRQINRYVKAEEPTTVCSIQRDVFKDVLLQNPEIAIELLEELTNRLNESEQQTTWITSESTSHRLAAYLLEAYNQQESLSIEIPSTKKQLASFLGMSPESFSRSLTKLTKAGIVRQPKPNVIEILELGRLEEWWGNYDIWFEVIEKWSIKFFSIIIC